ncbi:hypothetical protein NRA24_02175 [Acinetobacter baumannii]|nr:hypothetical protein [Acinetobacter baumannii]MDC5220936.1 hypothetical protein [Acinetobacter baumannii]
MNIFQITYFLSRSCLGEISKNFQRIYFTVNKKVITVFFFLEENNDDEVDDIKYEIMPDFEILIGDDEEFDGYEVNCEIILGAEKYLKDEDFEILVEFYRRKE